MAKTPNKTIEVQKFGGTDQLGKTKIHGNEHDVASVEVLSDTKLENDTGFGRPLVIRTFQFKVNKEAFKAHAPTKQELFDSHVRGIELALWRDGLTFCKDYEPNILFNKKSTHYTVFIIAEPNRSNVIVDKPMTLTEIANG